jgi:hypothetical protein
MAFLKNTQKPLLCLVEREEKENAHHGNTIAQCRNVWTGIMPD